MKCCDITPGMLNRKVEFYQLSKVSTPTGGFTEGWVLFASGWAHVKNMSGTELIHADQLGAKSFSDFTIRYRGDISETMKLVYRNTDYQIRHLNNLEEMDKWLVIKAERGVTQ